VGEKEYENFEEGGRKEVLSPSSLRKRRNFCQPLEKKKERGGREGAGKGKNYTQL